MRRSPRVVSRFVSAQLHRDAMHMRILHWCRSRGCSNSTSLAECTPTVGTNQNWVHGNSDNEYIYLHIITAVISDAGKTGRWNMGWVLKQPYLFYMPHYMNIFIFKYWTYVHLHYSLRHDDHFLIFSRQRRNCASSCTLHVHITYNALNDQLSPLIWIALLAGGNSI